MVLHCPFTSKAIAERSTANGCDSTYRYHCMRTKQGSLTEQCLEISWIQGGNCVIYNTDAKRVDAEKCNENLGICPQIQYLSNEVMQYSACVNVPEVQVLPFGPTSHTSKSPSDDSRFDNNNSTPWTLTIGIVLALIAIIAAIVIIVTRCKRRKQSFWKTKSEGIKNHKENVELSDMEERALLKASTEKSEKLDSTSIENIHDFDPFYKTRTYEYIERQIEESPVIILIIGNPGSGKSVLAKILHSTFCGKTVNRRNYISQCPKRLEDVMNDRCQDHAKMIHIVDDCFEDWIQYPHLVMKGLDELKRVHEDIVKGKNNSVVITMSKWNYDKNLNDDQKTRLKEWDQLKLVDLSVKEFELDITDKTGILEFHRKKQGSTVQRLTDDELRKVTDPGIMQSIASYLMSHQLDFEFPLSCHLLYLHVKFIEKKEDFFNDTKKKLWEYVKGLSSGSLEEKSQHCTLIYMVLCGGKVNSQDERNRTCFENIAKAANIELHELQKLHFDFGCCLITKGNDDTHEIVHEEITKFLFTSFGYARAGLVIDNCDIDVLLKYMRTDDGNRREDYYDLGFLVLKHNMYDRFAKKLQKVDESKQRHIIFKDEWFVRAFRTIVKKEIQKA